MGAVVDAGRRRFVAGVGAVGTTAALAPPSPSSSKAGPMKTRQIPSSSEAVPCIGMGTWSTFDVGPADYDARRRVLQAFFDAGGRLLDSSPMYGRAQRVLGELLPDVAGSKDAFVATKVWTRGKAPGRTQIAASTKEIGGRVDLMQVHNLLDYAAHIGPLRADKAAGRIRYVGITDYRHSAFAELERIMVEDGVDFVQLPYSVVDREAEKRLLPCAADTGTAVLVMRPFDEGDLFARVRGRALPEWAAELEATSWAQVFLKFVLAHPAVTCPIPATSKLSHMRDNLQAGTGPLPDAGLRRKIVAALGAGTR